MVDNDSDVDRRNVLRKASVGLASVAGIAGISGNASASPDQTDYQTGETVAAWPCLDCGSTMRLFKNPPADNWDHVDERVHRNMVGTVVETWTTQYETWVKVEFDDGPTGWAHATTLN